MTPSEKRKLLDSIRPGCEIKKRWACKSRKPQGLSGERMWVKVTKVTKGGFEGRLRNSAICLGLPKHGAKVFVKRSEVIEINCRGRRK